MQPNDCRCYHEASQDTQKLWLVCVAIGWRLVLLPGGIGAWRMGLIAASDAPCSILSMDAWMIDTDRQRQPDDGHEDAIKQERSRYSTKLIMEALQHMPWALTNYQLNRKHFSISVAPTWDQLHVVARSSLDCSGNTFIF